ncbi:MAG: YraN family protein [Neisseriaceae bacterium]|nr:YraN family protein [Neisseriaceae bacterium]
MKLNHAVAQNAEDMACDFLEQNGFSIVARNWHCTFGEIDIVAKQKQLLLFVEVKYRSNANFGGVAHSITYSKMQKIRRSIETYLQRFPHCGDIRADALLIEGNGNLQHIKNILE